MARTTTAVDSNISEFSVYCKHSKCVSICVTNICSICGINNIKISPPPQPFYSPFPGPARWAGARRELLDFMVQQKINRGRHTDQYHPAGCHSIRTNQCPPPSFTITVKQIRKPSWKHTITSSKGHCFQVSLVPTLTHPEANSKWTLTQHSPDGLGHFRYITVSVQRGGHFRYMTTSVHMRYISVHVFFAVRLRYMRSAISVHHYVDIGTLQENVNFLCWRSKKMPSGC